jgi:hypothetical protein
MEISGKLHASAILSRGNRPRYWLDGRLGGPQSRSGLTGEVKKNVACRKSNPSRPAHSPSLYRMIYSDSFTTRKKRGKAIPVTDREVIGLWDVEALNSRLTDGGEVVSLTCQPPCTRRGVFFFLIGIVGGGDQLGSLGTAATDRPIVPAVGDYDDGEIGGTIGKGNRSTRRKPAPVPLCPP